MRERRLYLEFHRDPILIVVREDGKIFKNGKLKGPSDNGSGYKSVCFQKTIDKKIYQKRFYVHRIVASAFLGDIRGKDINHKDFDRSNNALNNLEILTRKQNHAHTALHNRHNHKLKYSEYLRILELHYIYKLPVFKIIPLGDWNRDMVRNSILGKQTHHTTRYLKKNIYRIRKFEIKYWGRLYIK